MATTTNAITETCAITVTILRDRVNADGRRRARKISDGKIRQMAILAVQRAVVLGRTVSRISNGGDVANNCGHAATTSAAMVTADPTGRVCLFEGSLPARNVSDGGTADACIPGSRALYDYRCTRKETLAAARKVVAAAHAADDPYIQVSLPTDPRVRTLYIDALRGDKDAAGVLGDLLEEMGLPREVQVSPGTLEDEK